ncbi:B12-binding domain-containing radical SAM protein [Paramaledivibacter caminithermalis]|jgi:radical SAM superfamily enzyme YgiQ (UPF0313 family)|uniref:Radical SAM superfamily enzyme YgiQ, UPF0313 family n=1 Tax=Paramaledivibacter caminithermalis (strain DSM 15212 / CIP 107654 / DViRD3) TaxID=1121301 RepID=A0A1M6L654_PARC5|nr:radical SAM protein [Paramaledivibacter caminithermalis]SHJ66691.1 Radical SAM superfamily enzyme YgiQ, UPF0313 family [Paramaledivibacter caminithermalis DSM 15212]
MRVLLTNPPWHNIEKESGWLGVRAGSRWPHTWDYTGNMINPYLPFPFYLATATSFAKQQGFDAKIIDSIAQGHTYEEFYNEFKKFSPDILVIETSTPSLNNDLKIARKIKEINNNVIIIFCGIHNEIEETSFLEKYQNIDYTVYGEYEYPLICLMKALKNNQSFDDLFNVTYREKNGKVVKKPRGVLYDINKLPWPERDELPKTYHDGIAGDERPQLQITTSRGCVFNCLFCAWPQIMYGKRIYRKRDPRDVVDEILYNLEKYPYKNIFIDDDTFNISKEHVLELCRLFKENNLDKYQWAAMARADIIDKETLLALKDAGIYAIKYGVESFDEQVLKNAGKNMNIKKNIENILLTKELGIKVYLTFCLGLPGDTKETIEKTIDEAMKLPFDFAQFSIATPYPGSRMYEMYDKKGWIISNDWEKYNGSRYSVISTDTLNAQDLEYYHKLGWERSRMRNVTKHINSNEFEAKIKEHLEKLDSKDKVLVLQSANIHLTKEIIRKISSLCTSEIYILTHEKFNDEFKGLIPQERISDFNGAAHFDIELMKEDLRGLKETYDYKTVILPYSNEKRIGYENVEEVAKYFDIPIIGITIAGDVYYDENE